MVDGQRWDGEVGASEEMGEGNGETSKKQLLVGRHPNKGKSTSQTRPGNRERLKGVYVSWLLDCLHNIS